MAKVKVGLFHSIDMRAITLGGLFEGLVRSSTSTRFEVDYGGGNATLFRGRGLHYDASDYPIGGTFTDYSLFFAGRLGLSLEGAAFSATAVIDAARTKGKADDWKVLETALRGNDVITGGYGPDRLYGFAGHDRMDGGGLDDRLAGGSGNDSIRGGLGRDWLYGEDGNDRLQGGPDADRLHGGAGADTFVFRSLHDSTVARSGRDTIRDFSRKEGDRIDLKGIDADKTVKGDQAFDFIGTEKFHGKAGELRYATKSGDTILQGDVDGDGTADFSILLDATEHLKAGDFLL